MNLIVANTTTCPEGWDLLTKIGIIAPITEVEKIRPRIEIGAEFNDDWTFIHPMLRKKL